MELYESVRPRPRVASARRIAREVSFDDLDRKSLARVARGDIDALGDLFDRHAPAMLGVAHRILRDRGDAEDLLHDVFIEVSRKAESYDPRRARVRSWLMMRVRSRSIDRLRSLEVARRFGMSSSTPTEEPETEGVAATQEATSDALRARAALEVLTEAQLLIVELAYFEGLSLREIAEQRSIPLGTVKSRLAAALASLRASLKNGGRSDATRSREDAT